MTKYRSFRTGDGDKERGTLNLMASVGCGVCLRFETRCGHGLGIMNHVFRSSHGRFEDGTGSIERLSCRESRVYPACSLKRTGDTSTDLEPSSTEIPDLACVWFACVHSPGDPQPPPPESDPPPSPYGRSGIALVSGSQCFISTQPVTI